jgi:tetratricopeptide (TPR) repeat protein
MSASLRRGLGHVLWVALCVGVAACSSTPKGDEALSEKLALQEKLDTKLTAADAALKAGHTDQAMNSLDEAIQLDPSAKQPWLRKAQFHFEKRQYGVAITEAQEVLQRDVNDNTARSILAVSGLRVSAEALDQLRKANEVTGSARSEAESVAKIIREALGEPILVPPVAGASSAPEAAKPAPRVAARPAARLAAASAPSNTPVVNTTNLPAPAAGVAVKPRPVPAPAAGNGRSNPFGALQ